jgi:uncharacterized protein (DUF697 family)
MAEAAANPSWLDRSVAEAFRAALTRAYRSVQVDPVRYRQHLQRAYGVPASSAEEMFFVPVRELDLIGGQQMRGSMKLAAAEGAGFGLGGVAAVVPDMGVLAAITLRMLQKMSLLYGFEYNTEEEVAEFWIAAATAAGVDLGREVLEKRVLRPLAERAILRISERAGAEMAEKVAARAVPIVSSAAGAVINYYFVRAWGRRAQQHFRQRHLEERERRQTHALLPPGQ